MNTAKGNVGRLLCGALLAAPLALMLASCAGWTTRSQALSLQQATVEQLTDLLQERETAIQTMKGLFRAQVQGPGIPIAQRVEGAMFYRRPDRLRLQGFNRFGGELFEFILGGDRYMLRLPAGQVYAGRRADLDQAGKIAEPFKLSVLAMTGAIGIPSISKDERVHMAEEGERYRLDVFAPSLDGAAAAGPYRRIWFDRRLLQVVREDRLSPTGEIEATLELEDYRPVGMTFPGHPVHIGDAEKSGVLVKPFRITVQGGHGQSVLLLTFHEIIPNVPLKPEELRIAEFSAQEGDPSEAVGG